MMKQRWGLDRNVLRPTPGDPWGVEQHHWNTGEKENQQLNPWKPIYQPSYFKIFAVFVAYLFCVNRMKNKLIFVLQSRKLEYN